MSIDNLQGPSGFQDSREFERQLGEVASHLQLNQNLMKVGATTKPLPLYPDPVHHPAHYTQGSVECIDAIESALGPEGFIAFLRGQVIKYQWRLLAKDNPLQDAEKAQWYQAKLIEKLKQSDAGRPAQNGAEQNGN